MTVMTIYPNFYSFGALTVSTFLFVFENSQNSFTGIPPVTQSHLRNT